MNKIIYRDPQITIFQSVLYQVNSTVVCTDDLVLVIDPAFLPEEVLGIRRYVDEIRGNRPLFLVFTHSDFDHIIGYRAFEPDKVFMTEAMAQNPNRNRCIQDALDFDARHYITRPYPIDYPQADFQVYRDGVQFRQGQTKMTFYLTPGHTADSMMLIVWQLGLCIAGDYLSNLEFPFIEYSSVEYERTLDKLPRIHDRNWFTRMVPGHGQPALGLTDWLNRRLESLAYIYAIRESIATGIPFDESSLWSRYQYQRLQQEYHYKNVALMRKEFEEGAWTWDPTLSLEIQEDNNRENDDQDSAD